MVYENDITKHRIREAKHSPNNRSCGYCGQPTKYLVGLTAVCPSCARDMVNVSMCFNPTRAKGAEFAKKGGDAIDGSS